MPAEVLARGEDPLEPSKEEESVARIEAAVREDLARVLDAGPEAGAIDLDLDMADGLGLTSLNKVIFLMSACEDTGVSLSELTEADVAAMRTPRDVVTALARCQRTAG